MKSVVICGSARYADEISHFEARLKKLGVPTVLTPEFDDMPKRLQLQEEKIRLATKSYRDRVPEMVLRHFDRIRRADVCFVYNKDGYIGVNTTLEVGFAHGKEMLIYSLEPEKPYQEGGEPCRHLMFTETVPTPEDLFEKLLIRTADDDRSE